jgi:hypothetical protein
MGITVPAQIVIPEIACEDVATASVAQTLGFGREVKSRLTVGRSDALTIGVEEATADPALVSHLRARQDELVLVRLALRMSFRPSRGERFDRALLVVTLRSKDDETEDPIARVLVPDRLSAGPFTVARGMTLGIKAGVLGAGLDAQHSSTATLEIQRPYVYSAGLGESDPEWRYERTETVELAGTQEMALIVEARRKVPAFAEISASATVRAGLHSTDVDWEPRPEIANVALPV